jgi:hypothetical protein
MFREVETGLRPRLPVRPALKRPETTMTVAKPIPHSSLHKLNDDILKHCIRTWREQHERGEIKAEELKTLLNDAYAVLGYRCALEYIETYGA